MTITGRMRIAFWTPTATKTRSQCAVINSVLLQIWFHERASMLRYKYIACLVLLLLFTVGRQMLTVLCSEELSSEQTSVEIALCTIKSVTINNVRSSIRME
jgi:hypothetical protein